MKTPTFFQRTGDDKRVAFLTELLRGGSAVEAAARAGLSRGSVYRWKLTEPEFASVWVEIVAGSLSVDAPSRDSDWFRRISPVPSGGIVSSGGISHPTHSSTFMRI